MLARSSAVSALDATCVRALGRRARADFRVWVPSRSRPDEDTVPATPRRGPGGAARPPPRVPALLAALGGGVASVQPHHGDTVWGVVFDLDDGDLASLDADLGYRGPSDQHNLYDRESLTVELIRPDDASVPRR